MTQNDEDANIRVLDTPNYKDKPDCYVIYVSIARCSVQSDTDKSKQVPILALFGWITKTSLPDILPFFRFGMIDPDRSTIKLIYYLGHTTFYAKVTAPDPAYEVTDHQSTTPYMIDVQSDIGTGVPMTEIIIYIKLPSYQ